MTKLGNYRVDAKWTPRFRYAWTLSHIGTGFWGGGSPILLYPTAGEAQQANPDAKFQPVRVRVTIAEPGR